MVGGALPPARVANLWLLIPLSIIGALVLAWLAGQYSLDDFTAFARNLVKTTYK